MPTSSELKAMQARLDRRYAARQRQGKVNISFHIDSEIVKKRRADQDADRFMIERCYKRKLRP